MAILHQRQHRNESLLAHDREIPDSPNHHLDTTPRSNSMSFSDYNSLRYQPPGWSPPLNAPEEDPRGAMRGGYMSIRDFLADLEAGGAFYGFHGFYCYERAICGLLGVSKVADLISTLRFRIPPTNRSPATLGDRLVKLLQYHSSCNDREESFCIPSPKVAEIICGDLEDIALEYGNDNVFSIP